MKRVILLVLALLLLTACGRGDLPPSETVPVQTEPEYDWVAETGMAWDRQGALLEIPLNIPDGLHYSMAQEFDGDLLLWSLDGHLEDSMVMELCVVELDNGAVTAQSGVPVGGFLIPQVLDDMLYLCDNAGGTVVQLDKSLNEVRRWTVEPEEGTWYMGSNEKLYQYDAEYRLLVHDLTTGQREPVLEGNPEMNLTGALRGKLTVQYYRPDTGAQKWAAVDLHTGAVQQIDAANSDGSVMFAGNTWLNSWYDNGYRYHYSIDGAEPVSISEDSIYLQLLDDGMIMGTNDENLYLRLYDKNGKVVAACQLSESGTYSARPPIKSDRYDGYFLIVTGYDDHYRLLYWDTDCEIIMEDLVFEEIPKPEAEMLELQQRCEDLGVQYGVTILVGEDCDTQFSDFTASQVSDYGQINDALDVLEQALSVYPEGFIKQLRYDTIHGVQIHLIKDLWATGNGRSGDGYAAFTEPMWDHYLMVMDIEETSVETYYHEFSHIIDSYLEWDSWQREDALYSEDRWAELNPYWFEGYTYDYSWTRYVEDYAYFVDDYSTISPTEDRARVMEYGMAEYGGGLFVGADGLLEKLDYYCRCIRDAFDTAGWPKTVIWEQYL